MSETITSALPLPNNSTTTSFWTSLWERRVPQIIGSYLVASWALLQFIDWCVHRYLLSPNWVDLSFVLLLLMLPSVALVAFFHQTKTTSSYPKALKIGVPVNVLCTTVLLFLLFQNKNFNAVAKTVTVKNEQGEDIIRQVPDQSFRKQVAIFPFDNLTNDTSLNWLQYGISFLADYDLMQDMFMTTADGFALYPNIQKHHFSFHQTIPLALKIKIAEERHSPYFLTGAFNQDGQEYTLTTKLYETQSGKLRHTHTLKNSQLLDLIDELSLQLRQDLDIPQQHLSTTTDLPLSELTTQQFAALQAFIESIKSIRVDNDYVVAQQQLITATTIDSTFAFAQLYLAVTHAQMGQFDLAQAKTKATLDLSYKLPERIQYYAKSTHHTVTGDVEKRQRVLQVWTELYPDDSWAFQQLASFYYYRRKLPKALANYKKVLSLNGEQSSSLATVANILIELNQYDEAIEYYNRYQKLHPKEKNSYTQLGWAYEQKADLEQAQQYYEKALALSTDDLITSCAIGNILVKKGEFQKALEQYQDALTKSTTPTTQSRILGYLAFYYKFRGQYQKALSTFQEKWEVDKKIVPPLMAMFRSVRHLSLFAKAGQTEQAYTLLHRLKNESQPPISDALAIGYAQLYIEDKQFNKIDSTLAKAEATLTAMGDNNNVVPYLQAQAYEMEGKYEDAAKAYEAYLAKEPSADGLLTRLGTCYQKMGQLKKAEEYLTQELKRHPYEPEANYEWALCLLDKGKKEQAKVHLERAAKVLENADEQHEIAKKVGMALANL